MRQPRTTTTLERNLMEIQICGACRRERTLLDVYDYNPLQVLTGAPLGWYSGDDGEICPQCLVELMGLVTTIGPVASPSLRGGRAEQGRRLVPVREDEARVIEEEPPMSSAESKETAENLASGPANVSELYDDATGLDPEIEAELAESFHWDKPEAGDSTMARTTQTPLERAAAAVQAEIKAHPAFDPKPFGSIGTFPLGATMPDLARAVFRSIDTEALAAEIGRHGPIDADTVPGGMDCRCGTAPAAWEHIEAADRHVAAAILAALLEGSAQ
jgi:hypothetical protein